MGPKRRNRRWEVSGRSFRAPARRLCRLAAAITVLWPAVVVAVATAAPNSKASPGVRTIYHKARSFRIPFNLNAAGRDSVKELKLYYSEDQGYHWRPSSTTLPERPTFNFRSSHDGEYWFAVQTLTVNGKVSPRLDSTVEPNLKVVVDTFPPTLLLDAEPRRGSTAAIRWDAKDENLDLKSLVIEYQVEGVGVWRRVPIPRSRVSGNQQWDAGTAEALKVRASVQDRAGNVAEAMIDVPEGTATPSDLAANPPNFDGPPANLVIPEMDDPEIVAGQGFTPVNSASQANRKPNAVPVRSSTRAPRGTSAPAQTVGLRRKGPGGDRDQNQNHDQNPPDFDPTAAPVPENPPADLFTAGAAGASIVAPGFSRTEPALTAAPVATSTPGRDGSNTLLVDGPRFKLQYAIDDAGPNGPATVELWITQDGGRTWIRRADDPDRVSPIEVDLGGEGTYGLCLVARSASGLGDQPPAPGDPPQSWVEVDSTPPAIQLQPPQVGNGSNSGKVAIAWRVSDLHLAPRSVSLMWRPDQPNAPWQTIAEAQENAGQYVWNVPPAAPQRFHLKVEATDTVGHRGSADTTDAGAITVDRSRPRSRIIGLDPNARTGGGSSARPVQ